MADKQNTSPKTVVKKENQDDKDKNSKKAFEQAEHDIESDPATKLNPDDDLDEGELARKEGHP